MYINIPVNQKVLLTIIQLFEFPYIGTTKVHTVYLLQLGVQDVYQYIVSPSIRRLYLLSSSCLSSLTSVPLKCTLSICFILESRMYINIPFHQKALLTIIKLFEFSDVGTTEVYAVYRFKVAVQDVYQFPLPSEGSTYYHPAE